MREIYVFYLRNTLLCPSLFSTRPPFSRLYMGCVSDRAGTLRCRHTTSIHVRVFTSVGNIIYLVCVSRSALLVCSFLLWDVVLPCLSWPGLGGQRYRRQPPNPRLGVGTCLPYLVQADCYCGDKGAQRVYELIPSCG